MIIEFKYDEMIILKIDQRRSAGLGVGGTLGVVFASLAIIIVAIVLLLIAWRKYNKNDTEPEGKKETIFQATNTISRKRQ